MTTRRAQLLLFTFYLLGMFLYSCSQVLPIVPQESFSRLDSGLEIAAEEKRTEPATEKREPRLEEPATEPIIEPVIEDAGPEPQCIAGEQRACYTGLAATQGFGNCKDGVELCGPSGFWSGRCAGEVLPQKELCDGLDNNCDGQIDEVFKRKGEACDAGLGACKRVGMWVCKAAGDALECDAKPGLPTTEVCDGVDNDCDGKVDIRPCYPKDRKECGQDTNGKWSCVGTCSTGTQTCQAGLWGPCEKPTLPLVGDYCDKRDDDCDGKVDEDCCSFKQTSQWKGNASMTGVAYSLDFKSVATVSPTSGVTTYDLKGKRLASYRSILGKISIAFHPNNKWFAVGGDGSAELYQFGDGKIIKKLKQKPGYISNPTISFPNFLQFSAQGDALFGFFYTDISMWNTQDGSHLNLPLGAFRISLHWAVNKSGAPYLSSGSANRETLLWNWKTQKNIHIIKVPNEYNMFSEFSKDGKTLILTTISTKDSRIVHFQFMDLQTLKIIHSFQGMYPTIVGNDKFNKLESATSPDNSMLALRYHKEKTHIYDIRSGKTMVTLSHPASNMKKGDIHWSDDGQLLIGNPDDGVTLWRCIK